jgi:hypothetical protein
LFKCEESSQRPQSSLVEPQADHILGWIQRWRRAEFDTVEPTTSATESFNAQLRAVTPAEHRAMLAKTDPGRYELR